MQSAVKLQSSNHKSRLFPSCERNNESRYFIYILKRYFMSAYNYEVRREGGGFQADPGKRESRQEDVRGSRGRSRGTAGVSVSVSDTRRALRRVKKEESESERSAQKEIRALVDSGSGQFQTRRWTVSHAISVFLLTPALFFNARGRKM